LNQNILTPIIQKGFFGCMLSDITGESYNKYTAAFLFVMKTERK
jgi:hypothetical protein